MKKILLSFLVATFTVMMFRCAEDTTTSLYDPNEQGNPAPVVAKITPADSAYAVINNITFDGSNFSANIEENFVFFDGIKAEILSASTTQLVVKPPYMFGDSIEIKIAVHGAELFNENKIIYKLKDPAPEIYRFPQGDVPWKITVDANENVYTSLVSSGAGQGVVQITPAGEMSNYAPRGAELYWSSMKVGPGGVLICARGIRALFQIPAGGGKPATWAVNPNRSVKISDIDFDAEKNCWAVGDNSEIFRIKPDKSMKGFPFIGNVYSVRVFDNYIYLAAERDLANKIWRLPIISADELGAEEEYFDFSSAYPDFKTLAITFAEDGDMYIGTDAPEAIIVVHPDKSHEPLYPGLFEAAPIISMEWGNGTELYVTREAVDDISQTILKVGMSKNGAPYPGRTN